MMATKGCMCSRHAVVLAAVAAAACSSSSSQSSDAADHPTSAGDAALETNPGGGSDTATDSGSGPPDRPDDAQTSPPANITFPDSPSVSCHVDAGDQGGCDFPAPACAVVGFDDAGIQHGYDWLVYYDNPRCVAGHCAYDKLYYQCTGATTCSNGGCRYNFTLQIAP
jgi:hypothetical protein